MKFYSFFFFHLRYVPARVKSAILDERVTFFGSFRKKREQEQQLIPLLFCNITPLWVSVLPFLFFLFFFLFHFQPKPVGSNVVCSTDYHIAHTASAQILAGRGENEMPTILRSSYGGGAITLNEGGTQFFFLPLQSPLQTFHINLH